MATLREAARLTEELEELAVQLNREMTEGDVDFTEMVRLADELGESADSLAATFSAIDEALTQRLPGLAGGEEAEAEEERETRGREGQPREQSGRAETDEGPTKEELLERAKDLGIQGRSSMTKEELAEAIQSAEQPSQEDLLDRAREAGIEGRSSMTKEELREALDAEASLSKEELLERAREADLPGRSEMSKEELREALRSS